MALPSRKAVPPQVGGTAHAAWFDRIKDAIDLHDLAQRLGLERVGQQGNYRSPHHTDKHPSLSITPNGRGWKDWSGDAGGSCIDLLLYVQPELASPMAAAKQLATWYGVSMPGSDRTNSSGDTHPPTAQKSIPDYIADRALAEPEAVVSYLATRSIDEAVTRNAIRHRALGWSTWASAKVPAGEVGHGGPAAVFVVRGLDQSMADINDVLQHEGKEELARRLRKLEPWLIAGMPGGGDHLEGTRRIFLPEQDYKVYWRYRVREDFTQYVDEFKEGDDGRRQETLADLCSFRIAGLSRLTVQGHLATINGSPDTQAETVFGISAQAPRHGAILQREVVDDRMLFSQEWWRSRFGAIFKPNPFMRMLNILERAADLNAREVVNFVGLAWRNGEPAALEGRDCYFLEPAKQCLYHNMVFPRGNAQAARTCIEAFQNTFHDNAALIPFVWALGAHLKAVLGFYPHFQMQAEKGSGKSKLLESMQATLAFQVLSGQMLKTDHRRRASVSYTSHPVGWDEFSKLPKNTLSDIDGLLQSTYRFEFTRVGATLTPYL